MVIMLVLIIIATIYRDVKNTFDTFYMSPFNSHDSKVLTVPEISQHVSVSPGFLLSFAKPNIFALFTLL